MVELSKSEVRISKNAENTKRVPIFGSLYPCSHDRQKKKAKYKNYR